jgi:hypothetical protein
VPLKSDYQHADQLLGNLLDIYNKRKDDESSGSESSSDGYSIAPNPPIDDATMMDILYRLKHELLKEDNHKHVRALLPETLEDLKETMTSQRGATAQMHLQHKHRDHKDGHWLKQHGKCLTNIRAGLSTIPGAGRGAFATKCHTD